LTTITDGPNPFEVKHLQRPAAWGRTDRIRLLMWVGIAFLIPGVCVFAFHLSPGDSALTVRRELPIETLITFFVILATWIISRVERRPLADYGIPIQQAFGKRFWEGGVWGFAMLSGVLLVLQLQGHFRIDSVALQGRAAFFYAFAWAFTFLAVALSEEFAFRGYWLFSFSRRLRFWPAAFFISLVFGGAHLANHGENTLGIVQTVATGLILCFSVRRTGTLWFAVGFHAAWDWAQTFFYGTPDSGLLGIGRLLNSSVEGPAWLTGGTAGPEGSIIGIFVLFLCALLIHLRFPNVNYPDRPV
jgi:uncharacterized protein